MCIIDCLSTIVFILPLHLDYTKVIILILWWRNFQLEYWRTFQLVSTSDLLMEYEAYLKNRGNSPNTISFYMRILKAVYNRAVENGLTGQRNLFKSVYTGVEKTLKRAIHLNDIRRIKRLDLSLKPHLDFARDMFLFCFYTRGMSFVDMAYLKKGDIANGILTYRRKKTGQQLFIRWEKCMQEIIKLFCLSVQDFKVVH